MCTKGPKFQLRLEVFSFPSIWDIAGSSTRESLKTQTPSVDREKSKENLMRWVGFLISMR